MLMVLPLCPPDVLQVSRAVSLALLAPLLERPEGAAGEEGCAAEGAGAEGDEGEEGEEGADGEELSARAALKNTTSGTT